MQASEDILPRENRSRLCSSMRVRRVLMKGEGMKRIGALAIACAVAARVLRAPPPRRARQTPRKTSTAASSSSSSSAPSSGQDYDLWARLIGRHITRHIPGQPSLIVENMPGAGHIVATNHLFNVAPRDGTAIGMVSRGMTDAAIMKVRNIRFEPGRFNWLGSPEVNHRVMFVSAAAGIAGVADLFERELIVGAPGGGQGVTAAPILLKNLLGMKLKIVTGYRSPGEVVLAVTRGEVGSLVTTVGGPVSARRQWVADGKMRVLFNMEPERVPWLDAPTIFEFARSRGAAPGADVLRRQYPARPSADGAARGAGRARRACCAAPSTQP